MAQYRKAHRKQIQIKQMAMQPKRLKKSLHRMEHQQPQPQQQLTHPTQPAGAKMNRHCWSKQWKHIQCQHRIVGIVSLNAYQIDRKKIACDVLRSWSISWTQSAKLSKSENSANHTNMRYLVEFYTIVSHLIFSLHFVFFFLEIFNKTELSNRFQFS